jgi:iron complex transport system substrate-binding protein
MAGAAPDPCHAADGGSRGRAAPGPGGSSWRAIPVASSWRAIALAGLLLSGFGAAAAQAPPPPIAIVDDRGHRVELPAPARRIVSMLPSLTETVCALQACDRLVGVDRSSDFPPEVRALPRVGGLDDTLIERIVALRPDLVLAPSSSRAIDRLEGLGLRVLALEPKGFADMRRVLGAVATALGVPGAGDALWRSIDARIDAAAARVPDGLRGARVYFEVSDAPHAAGAASFVGETLARLGLGNVVPAALGPFPQVNPEFVVRAAPDIVMAAERNLARMPTRPGWAGLPALRERRVCGFAPARYDLLVRAGPRLGEAADTIVECLATIGAAPR